MIENIPPCFLSLYNTLQNFQVDASGTKDDWWLRGYDILLQTAQNRDFAVRWLEWNKSHDYAKGFKDKFNILYADVQNFYKRLSDGELDDYETLNEASQIIESSAKQLAEDVMVAHYLFQEDRSQKPRPKKNNESMSNYHLQEDDVRILQFLNSCSPILQPQSAILAKLAEKKEGKRSLGNIRNRLNELRNLGMTHRPKGGRGGETITELGIRTLKDIE